MQGLDGLFHVAAWYRIGDRAGAAQAERVNVDGTRNVLEAAREAGVPKIVYTSTVAVLGDTRGRLVDETHYSAGPFLTEYDRTKWIAHYQVALPMIREGLPLVITMPGVVYGPGDHSAMRSALVQLLRGRLIATPRGATFCWGYIEDTARGLRQAMDAGRPGESYLLTGPVHTFEEAMDLAARLANRRRPLLHPPPGLVRGLAAVMARLERWNIEPPFPSEGLRVMAGTSWIGSSKKAQCELGFSARPLEDGLKHTIEHELRLLGAS
jgi:nucleoside-diphosphate-sugar epimerase